MNKPLRNIKQCFEGAIPAGIATCSAEGVANVTYISHVHLIDDNHVAISYQFLNKTRSNLTANPQAALLVIDPVCGIQYRLQLHYQKQETSGSIFDKVKTRLDAIASMSGMSAVFKLKGVDIFEVIKWESMEQNNDIEIQNTSPDFAQLNEITQAISNCEQLDELLETTLNQLHQLFGFEHAMVLFINPQEQSLYTIASHGYEQQGAGAEVKFGEGVIGTVAKERKAVNIANMQRENILTNAVQQQMAQQDNNFFQAMHIPLPGLSKPNSQFATPIESRNQLLGVLFLESENNMQFEADTQALISTIANHLGSAIPLCLDDSQLQIATNITPETKSKSSSTRDKNKIVKVRHFKADNSIFLNSDYLIKGVAGAILWYLLQVHLTEGRTNFTNRELRMASELNLPDIADNLEARLVLLRRRLADRNCPISIESTGRGRFQLQINNPLDLLSVNNA